MSSGSALPSDVLPPGCHHCPPLLEQVGPPIGAFDALDDIGQRRLRRATAGSPPRYTSLCTSSGTRESSPARRRPPPTARSSAPYPSAPDPPNVPGTPGRTPSNSRNRRKRSRTATGRGLRGTQCSFPAFIRSPGSVQVRCPCRSPTSAPPAPRRGGPPPGSGNEGRPRPPTFIEQLVTRIPRVGDSCQNTQRHPASTVTCGPSTSRCPGQ